MNWRKWVPVIIIVAAGLGAYCNSLTGPFIFDDYNAIVHNEHIREWWPVWDAMAAPPQSTVDGRPVVSLSLALNYALGGLHVWGYHVFNLVTHILAALVLFGVVRRTLSGGRLRNRYGAPSRWLALAVAVLWMVHPLLTESVDYVVQRTELLMGLFYLLTLYCVIHGRESRHRHVWYTAAVLTCALGMGCKEVMVSAPLLVVLYDRIFWSSTFRQAWHERRELYVGLAATWVVLAAALLGGPRTETVGFGFKEITPVHYALTQCGVLVHYLQLALWPAPLVLDYTDWPVARTLGAVWPAAVVIVGLLAATVWALARRAPVGILGAWFFLILAPTSSVLPIATEVMVERRMYLPLVAVVVPVVLGGYAWLRRFGRRGQIGVAALVAVALGLTTFRRNADYRTEERIWRDSVTKRPDNTRARINLGTVLAGQGQSEAAIEQYHAALRANPRSAEACFNLGITLAGQGKLEEGAEQLTRAAELEPASGLVRYNLGLVLAQQDKLDLAITNLTEAVRLNPRSAPAHKSLGAALAKAGRIDEALTQLREAVQLRPEYAEAHYNLGLTLMHANRMPEALTAFEAAVRLDPAFDIARQSRDQLAGQLQSQAMTIGK